MNQSFLPDEIIVVDDASTDRSIELIRPMLDERVRLLIRDVPGPGGYAARNLAIQHANSEWIAFLDADDMWATDHLETLDEAIRNAGPEPSCVFSGYERREDDESRTQDWYTAAGKAPGARSSAELLEDWIQAGCPLWMGAVAIRKAKLLEAGLFPAGRCRRGGDRVLWLKTILRTGSVYTGKVTATYNCGADNMISKKESYSIDVLKETILQEINLSDDVISEKLKILFNDEVFIYVAKSWKRGFDIVESDFKYFFVQHDFARYLAIRAMHLLPLPIPAAVRALIRKLRGRS
jgi:glycosyltransferase involved in cell wall biosynthesis